MAESSKSPLLLEEGLNKDYDSTSLSEEAKPRTHLPRSCSGVCGTKGVVLKACSGCRKVAYCSRKCQKDNWKQHKEFCSKNVEESIFPLVNRAFKDEKFDFWFNLCMVYEFGIKKSDLPTLARKPLFVQVNVGLEPEDIFETLRLYRLREAWHPDIGGKHCKGMLQFHHVAPLDRWKPGANPPRPEAVKFWQLHRDKFDKKGMRDIPIVFVTFTDGYERHHWGMTMFIHEIYVDQAEKMKSQTFPTPVTSPMGPPFAAMQQTTANYLNMMNEMIREDTANKMRLRAPMRACDKKLIVDARWKTQLDFTQAVLKCKMLREPVYRMEAAGEAVQAIVDEHFADPDRDTSSEAMAELLQTAREKVLASLTGTGQLNWELRAHDPPES